MSRLIYTICILTLLTLGNDKTFANISLNITVTEVDSETFDYGTHLLYNGMISATVSGGVAPYLYTLISPAGNTLQQRNGYFPGLDAGSYTLIATDATGQTTTSTVPVIYHFPQPSVTVSDLILPGCTPVGRFTLNGSGGTPPYSYSIDGGVSFTSGNTFSDLAQGNYVIIIRDAKGQLGMIGTNTTSKTIPGFIGLFSTLCDVTASSQFSPSACSDEGSMHITLFSNTNATKFSLDGVHFIALKLNPNIPQLNQYEYDSLGLVPGLYDVYIGNNGGALSVYAYVIIRYCTIPIGFTTTSASCGGSDGSLTVVPSGGSPPYTYSMDGLNYQTSPLFTGLAAGNYEVAVRDVNGLTSFAADTLKDKCPISVSAKVINAACGNQPGSISVSVVGGSSPYLYSIDNLFFQAADTFSNLTPGNYTVTVTDKAGLKGLTAAFILAAPIPGLSAIATAASCTGNDGSITVKGKDGTPPYQYSLNAAPYQDNSVFAGVAPGNYSVTLKDINGCTASQPVNVALIRTQVKVSAGPDTSVLINQTLLLHATDVENIGFTGYQWSPPDGLNDPDIPNPIATLRQSARYTVRATTASGCEATASVSIKVFANDDLYVPGAFSPNGDGHNDVLKVIPIGISHFDYFAVYDRLGQLVFYTADPGQGWDGTLKGQPQATGAYIWTTGGTDYTGK
ncbi:MAG TPA: gliding motility-associated C-terminal domain-containing protein, partial [Puia sp.]